jgi:hypothetical protein
MRQTNENGIKLTTDYQTESNKAVSQLRGAGQAQKGVEHTSPLYTLLHIFEHFCALLRTFVQIGKILHTFVQLNLLLTYFLIF